MKRCLIAFALFACMMITGVVEAQTTITNKTDTISVIGHKGYYLHTVLQGQNLFRIALTYEVKVEQIEEENPELSAGLKPGMVLRVPAKIQVPVVNNNKETTENKTSDAKTQDTIIKDPVITNVISPPPPMDTVKYKVPQGETLYSIARKFNLSEDEITNLNPSLKTEGLKAGQILNLPAGTIIPVDEETSNVEQANEDSLKFLNRLENIKMHTVERKETLYSIAKEYNIEVEDIQFLNPNVKDGIKKGDILKIPVFGETKGQSLFDNKTNEPKDTVKIVTPDKIIEPVFKKEYNVAFLVPFHLNEINPDAMFDKSEDDDSEDGDEKDTRSMAFFDFYQGALIALDSLKKTTSLGIRVYTYDTREDTATVKRIIEKPEMAEMDLVIGPFFRSNLGPVVEFTKAHNIPLVSPVSPYQTVVEGNENVLKVIPSMDQQMAQVAEVIADSFANSNIIVIYRENERDSLFADILYNYVKGTRGHQHITKLSYTKKGIKGVEALLCKDTMNLIAVVSNNQIFVSGLVTTLNLKTEHYPITVLGMPKWKTFTNIELEYLQKLNFHAFGPGFTDYTEPAVKDFICKYYKRYYNDPGRYAFLGYDVTMYFVKGLLTKGKNFSSELGSIQYNPLNLRFNFVKEPGNGFTNQFVSVFKYVEYQQLRMR
ncbi:MAG: LysM peptidoglycan-binding domain-containing protein [Bacteroidetes bacterium]|nr:LysM peptidoglycan-binding domain-containing protein [Bacteroidota bacterium]MBU1718237.1 LysM peptidoglycan-binding domain-containing protein [Bacteroidota bacterium]